MVVVLLVGGNIAGWDALARVWKFISRLDAEIMYVLPPLSVVLANK